MNLNDFSNGAELAHVEGCSSNRATEPVEFTTYVERTGLTPKRIQVDKRSHRIRFENETESQVTVVIEPKGV